jgi:hypothetical protein
MYNASHVYSYTWLSYFRNSSKICRAAALSACEEVAVILFCFEAYRRIRHRRTDRLEADGQQGDQHS